MEDMPQSSLGKESPSQSYEQECAERAGKTLYWDVDGIAVKQIYSEDGTYSDRYGLRDGKWVLGYPGDSTFYQSAQSISEDEFNSLLS